MAVQARHCCVSGVRHARTRLLVYKKRLQLASLMAQAQVSIECLKDLKRQRKFLNYRIQLVQEEIRQQEFFSPNSGSGLYLSTINGTEFKSSPVDVNTFEAKVKEEKEALNMSKFSSLPLPKLASVGSKICLEETPDTGSPLDRMPRENTVGKKV